MLPLPSPPSLSLSLSPPPPHPNRAGIPEKDLLRELAQLLAPQRAVGSVVAHHGDVVHGVTRLLGGMRYGLFALVAREDAVGV